MNKKVIDNINFVVYVMITSLIIVLFLVIGARISVPIFLRLFLPLVLASFVIYFEGIYKGVNRIVKVIFTVIYLLFAPVLLAIIVPGAIFKEVNGNNEIVLTVIMLISLLIPQLYLVLRLFLFNNTTYLWESIREIKLGMNLSISFVGITMIIMGQFVTNEFALNTVFLLVVIPYMFNFILQAFIEYKEAYIV